MNIQSKLINYRANSKTIFLKYKKNQEWKLTFTSDNFYNFTKRNLPRGNRSSLRR